jgi:predicted ferric reductase
MRNSKGRTEAGRWQKLNQGSASRSFKDKSIGEHDALKRSFRFFLWIYTSFILVSLFVVFWNYNNWSRSRSLNYVVFILAVYVLVVFFMIALFRRIAYGRYMGYRRGGKDRGKKVS